MDWFTYLVSLATPAIAAASAIYVYFEYTQRKRWRQFDLAREAIDRLSSDEEFRLACQALDWGIGPLPIPKKYSYLFGGAQDSTGKHAPLVSFEHSPEVLDVAMRPALQPSTLADPRGLVYRGSLDSLFSHLDSVGRAVRLRQIRPEYLGALSYWLRAISDYQYADIDGKETFQPFVAAYGYNNLVTLGRSLGVKDWQVYDRVCNELVTHQNASA